MTEQLLRELIRDEQGASFAEYALLLTIGSLALVGAVRGLRESVVGSFSLVTALLAGLAE